MVSFQKNRISMETCFSTRFLETGLYVTILKIIPTKTGSRLFSISSGQGPVFSFREVQSLRILQSYKKLGSVLII
jgi:hypothetical protein